MISVVIRNRNQADYLERTLKILTSIYLDDIGEIIVIDNKSTDNSIQVAEKYGCKVHTIDDFTYGKAINQGIEVAENPYIVLISSHVCPIGNMFFKNSIEFAVKHPDLAGIRYISSFKDLERCVLDNNQIIAPIDYGLNAACCLVSKKVWDKHKFNEQFIASEDKEWSIRVCNDGFKIYTINETYFYYLNRSKKSSINRFKIETIIYHQLRNTKYSSKVTIFLAFFKQIFIVNNINYFFYIFDEFRWFLAKLEINRKVNKLKK